MPTGGCRRHSKASRRTEAQKSHRAAEAQAAARPSDTRDLAELVKNRAPRLLLKNTAGELALRGWQPGTTHRALHRYESTRPGGRGGAIRTGISRRLGGLPVTCASDEDDGGVGFPRGHRAIGAWFVEELGALTLPTSVAWFRSLGGTSYYLRYCRNQCSRTLWASL